MGMPLLYVMMVSILNVLTPQNRAQISTNIYCVTKRTIVMTDLMKHIKLVAIKLREHVKEE
jgi:hypothetical protein